MKKIIGALLALCTSVAFAATTVPVQLLNPTGSSSGQAIVSTGASSAPAWGGIGVNGIAAIAANTVLANATGSSASPTAFAMPSCSATGNALAYTSGTGFTCNTSLFSSPTITTPNIVGVTNASNANAGSVGEFLSANRVSGSALSLTNATSADMASVPLTAGDWQCWGGAGFTVSVGASALIAWINTTSNTQPLLSSGFGNTQLIMTSASISSSLINVMPTRINVSSPTTAYLTVQANFASGTAASFGFIGCRRIH